MDNETKKSDRALPGRVVYPDGSVLLRPQQIRGIMLVPAVILLLAAIFIAFQMVSFISSKVIYASNAEKEQIETIVTASSTLDAPLLTTYATYSDEEILADFQQRGVVVVGIPQTNDSVNTIDAAKSTDQSASLDIAAFYANDGSGFSTLDSVKILNNSWRLTVSRATGLVMRIRFADFTSASPEAAISRAMAQQGLSEESATPVAVDDSNNSYREGVVETANGTMSWRVSAIDIAEVYSLSNLPNDAYYVGIRMVSNS